MTVHNFLNLCIVRQRQLVQIANRLKYLAETYKLAVLVTNQITSSFQEVGRSIKAALGVTWAHAINSRFLLSNEGSKNVITIAKSPSQPLRSFPYEISKAGFTDFPDLEIASSEDDTRNIMQMRIRQKQHC